jgi:AcrR family transcriptional regulator
MRSVAVREDLKDVILNASNRLLIRYGYRKMTMDDLAKEAGIGKGTIYLYFRSKEEVALSCADRLTLSVQKELRQIASSEGSPAERIRKMLTLRVLMRFDNAQPYARSLDDIFMALRPAFLARRERWLEAEAQIFADVLIEGHLLGAFAPGDAMRTAHALLLATNSLMPFSLSPQELGAREEIERKVNDVADLTLAGILLRTPAAPK